MEKKKGHPLARLFFGVFFLLLSAVVLLVNLSTPFALACSGTGRSGCWIS